VHSRAFDGGTGRKDADFPDVRPRVLLHALGIALPTPQAQGRVAGDGTCTCGVGRLAPRAGVAGRPLYATPKQNTISGTSTCYRRAGSIARLRSGGTCRKSPPASGLHRAIPKCHRQLRKPSDKSLSPLCMKNTDRIMSLYHSERSCLVTRGVTHPAGISPGITVERDKRTDDLLEERRWRPVDAESSSEPPEARRVLLRAHGMRTELLRARSLKSGGLATLGSGAARREMAGHALSKEMAGHAERRLEANRAAPTLTALQSSDEC
jgi:hypothetical protein